MHSRGRAKFGSVLGVQARGWWQDRGGGWGDLDPGGQDLVCIQPLPYASLLRWFHPLAQLSPSKWSTWGLSVSALWLSVILLMSFIWLSALLSTHMLNLLRIHCLLGFVLFLCTCICPPSVIYFLTGIWPIRSNWEIEYKLSPVLLSLLLWYKNSWFSFLFLNLFI